MLSVNSAHLLFVPSEYIYFYKEIHTPALRMKTILLERSLNSRSLSFAPSIAVSLSLSLFLTKLSSQKVQNEINGPE